jgi:periplasmic copper chaperone A
MRKMSWLEKQLATTAPAVAFLAAALLAGCGSQAGSGSGGGIVVEGAWARPMPVMAGEPSPSGVNSAVYLTLRNLGPLPDRLAAGETPAAESVEIHESRMEDGIMKMRPVDGIGIPAGAVVELQPGGLHLMLLNLRSSLVEGDTVALSLRFEEAGSLDVRVPVRAGGGA